MGDRSDDHAGPVDDSRRLCAKCGEPYLVEELKRTILPPAIAMHDVSELHPDDLEPPELETDHRLYCPWCRWSVNLRRALLVIAFILWVLYMAKQVPARGGAASNGLCDSRCKAYCLSQILACKRFSLTSVA